MKLILLRHGEMSGDPYLCPEQPVAGCLTSENGIPQAEKTARALQHEKVDVVLSSTYGRALQTAEIVFEGRSIPIKKLHFLREWEPSPSVKSMDRGSFSRKMTEYDRLFLEETWKTDLGEGKYDMYSRIIPPLLAEFSIIGIKSRYGGFVLESGAEDAVVAIVAHGGSLNIILEFLLGCTVTPMNTFSFELTGSAQINFVNCGGIHYPQLVIPALHKHGAVEN